MSKHAYFVDSREMRIKVGSEDTGWRKKEETVSAKGRMIKGVGKVHIRLMN